MKEHLDAYVLATKKTQEVENRVNTDGSLTTSVQTSKPACVTDIEQNMGYVSTGKWVPCLVKHGKLISISQEKLFIPWEHMAIMGEDVFEVTEKYRSLLAGVKTSGTLKDTEIKRLAGNAFHAVAAGAFLAYILSSLQQKGTLGSCDNLGALMQEDAL